jgi:hypothetical protein
MMDCFSKYLILKNLNEKFQKSKINAKGEVGEPGLIHQLGKLAYI